MFNTLRTSYPGASFEAQSLFQARLTALRITTPVCSPKGYVGLLGACTANQYSFLTGLSLAILVFPARLCHRESGAPSLQWMIRLIVPLPLAFLVIIRTLRMSVSYRPPSHLSKASSWMPEPRVFRDCL